MSADKRKTILIGFAGLAVVLVAIIAIVSPSFRSEDATGAIGAVQKHRAPQITKQDVVLGNEKVKQEQKILYADYLTDAAALKSFSNGLSARDNAVQARIESAKQDVESRFRNDFEVALGVAKQLGETEAASLGTKQQAAFAEINELGVKAQQARLSDREMADLAMRLNAVTNTLGVARYMRVEVTSSLQSVDALQATLKQIEQADLASTLRAEADYALAMAKQAQILASTDEVQALGTRLNDEALALESAAQANMQSALQSESEEIAALGKMAQAINALGARQNAQDLGVLTRDLQGHAAEAEANLGAMARDRAQYAAVLSDSDAFSTQAHALINEAASLGSRFQK
ncbi:MAG TPA: hypothetical protein VLV78_23590 [Thermoanaerobaculia bacterium]|nr:hypothetical protein [Thermoanaerobaculia bacterium]